MPYMGAKRFTTKIDLGDGGFVVLRRLTTAEENTMAGSADGKPNSQLAEEMLDLVASLIVEWNVCDENDQLVNVADKAAVVVALKDMPGELTRRIFTTLMENIKGRDEKSERRFPDAVEGNVQGNATQGQ